MFSVIFTHPRSCKCPVKDPKKLYNQFGPVLLLFGQLQFEHLSIWTNTFCQFGQIHFVNLDKYILQLGQTYIPIKRWWAETDWTFFEPRSGYLQKYILHLVWTNIHSDQEVSGSWLNISWAGAVANERLQGTKGLLGRVGGANETQTNPGRHNTTTCKAGQAAHAGAPLLINY